MGKWYFIAVAVIFGAMAAGMAFDNVSENQAKRDIVVACYNAGKENCQQFWASND